MRLLLAILNLILAEYTALKNGIQFKIMKRRAINLHKQTGKRYYVLPGVNKPYFIVNNETFKQYKKMTKRDVNIANVLKLCYFYTPDNGKCK